MINDREIKFRGKRKDNGEWVYGFFFKIGLGNLRYVSAIQIIDENNIPVPIEVVPETVGQFIGKKDSYGNDIYNGDIILDCDGGHNLVEWSKGTLNWVLFGDPICDFDEIKVIGNIHDNPDHFKK